MDEPTNDLDLETLELLEAQLVEWPGTLLLVSHDRVFLDNVVTSTIVFEGDGRIEEYVGGYADWLRQRRRAADDRSKQAEAQKQTTKSSAKQDAARRSGKLSYKEQRELETLPHRIEVLESEHGQLQAGMASADFYKESAEVIARTMARSGEVEHELLVAYERWDELEARR